VSVPGAVAADRSGALALWLDDGEDVVARVHEPSGPGMAHVGDAVGRDRVGRLVLLDPDTSAAQFVDRRMDIRDTPRHLGLRVPGPDRALGDDDLGAAPGPEDDPVAGILAGDLEPEQVAVE